MHHFDAQILEGSVGFWKFCVFHLRGLLILVLKNNLYLHKKVNTYRPLFRLTRGTDKSLARPTSRCILFDGENIFLMLVLLIKNIYK
jgi:hypothetical protein